MDAILANYINVLYQQGDSLTQAGWLLSGLKRFIPQLRFQLLTAQQYYQNWLRDHVPQRATPMPWLVLKPIASLAWRLGHIDIALILLVGFCFFLRTTEFLTLSIENIQTKTFKQLQQSLVLRHDLLAKILHRGPSHLPPSGPLWRNSPHVFLKFHPFAPSRTRRAPSIFSVYIYI